MKKIYVIIKGRSGNQLFQYAFARMLQEMIGGELILDFSELGFNKSLGKYGPEKNMDNVLDYFNVHPYTYVDAGTAYKGGLFHRAQIFIYRLFRKLYVTHPNRVEAIADKTDGLLQRMGVYFQFGTNSFLGYRRPPKHVNTLLVRGWFESASYFEKIQDKVRAELSFRQQLPGTLEDIRRKLSLENSICAHIRRGDFVSDTFKDEFHICTLDYYKKGISLILDRHPNALLFFCSDDIEWCKEQFGSLEGCTTLYEPAGIAIYETMQLMTACHHFVISNSTLSFWMQYLSNHPDKMVVAPSVWRRCDPPVKDIYMKDWILLDC